MFQTEIEDGESFLSFFFQQAGVVLAWFFWGVLSAEWFALLNGFGPAGRLAKAVGNILWALAPAFFLGVLIQSRFAQVGRSGRWLWLLPSALLAWVLVSSVFDPRLEQDLSDLFFPPDDGDSFWAVALFSYPTLGCIGYSLGIAFQRRRPIQRHHLII